VVVIPAHNESASIAVSVASVTNQCYPSELRRVVVVADNCEDDTARVAGNAGAEVWERTDRQRRGKGAALAWAFERMQAENPRADAVVVMDADCTAGPDLLASFAQRLADGASFLQGRYEANNSTDSPDAALRSAAFLIYNVVRPRGKCALGLSAGLSGTGMCLRLDGLDAVPWEPHSVVEDLEHHAAILAAGMRVQFVDSARVFTPVPQRLRGTREQQQRWDGGRMAVSFAAGRRLLRLGLRTANPRTTLEGVELMLLFPQGFQALVMVLALTLAAVSRSRTSARLSMAAMAGEAVYVVGGLAQCRAPRHLYLGLLQAPRLLAGKLPVYAGLVRHGAPKEWGRSVRNA
jgi:cellulose synthase/poly-beta-1,6-N-acetylglucosamine synthase-like glycosyltransferase